MSNKIKYLESAANRIRLKSLQMTTKAGSGHATTAMSSAEILSVLYLDQMIYDPDNPDSYFGDDFVMSKGHGSPGLYAAMDEAGMLKKEDIMDIRQFDSILEGHPVPKLPGVRLATGSLGQGLSGGIGLAMAMKMNEKDRYVYVLIGDAEMAEGNIWEAVNFAPHAGLNNLIGIIDVNRLGQSGPSMYEWDMEAYQKRIEAFGWHTQIIDGHNTEQIINAIEKAKKASRPSMIIAKTVKGKGISFLENKEGQHGKPVSEDELAQAEEELKPLIEQVAHTPLNQKQFGTIPEPKETMSDIKTDYSSEEKEATRTAYGKALEKMGKEDKNIVVLDGDVKNSTRTIFSFKSFPERSIECYIAEQNMLGIAAGLQARGKKPHAATFAAFLTRAHDQIRMASFSQADLKLAGSHTGVSIGQDGPSQMGLEDVAMMRSIHQSVVLSPSDAVSAVKLTLAMNKHKGISYIRTIREKTPVIYKNDEQFEIGGSKILHQSDNDKVMILATGITVHEALKAKDMLKEKGISAGVMDIYSIKPLDKENILKATKQTENILTVEDHYPEGGMGEAVSAAIGTARNVHIKAVIKLPHSGKPHELMAEQGIDAEGIVNEVNKIIKT